MNRLLAPEVQNFIRDHEKDDPLSLILKNKAVHGVTAKVIAAQIAARQKARNKLPEWYHTDGIIYPPMISMEQCSSEITARYKASLVSGNLLFDLTGGAGVDTFYFSRQFKNAMYVELNADLVQIAAHNFRQLGAKNVRCVNDTAEAFLAGVNLKADIIFLDPARRDQNAQKVFRFEDSEPDVLKMLPLLLTKGYQVLIKASPMLDIELSVNDLKHVCEIHVVSVDNECKEVLYRLKEKRHADPEIITVNLKKKGEADIFQFKRSLESSAEVHYSAPGKYLYEPNAAILKAGAFKTIAQRFNLHKLHPQTHLYTSGTELKNFPGRRFAIKHVTSYQRKAVKPLIPLQKANIATRNFPDDVKMIKTKLGLSDGGNIFLFAFTDHQENKKIAITHKLE